jgi:hypothetical protein
MGPSLAQLAVLSGDTQPAERFVIKEKQREHHQSGAYFQEND